MAKGKAQLTVKASQNHDLGTLKIKHIKIRNSQNKSTNSIMTSNRKLDSGSQTILKSTEEPPSSKVRKKAIYDIMVKHYQPNTLRKSSESGYDTAITKFLRMKAFSSAVQERHRNEIKCKPFQVNRDHTNNSRFKALEFAKTIRKPRLHRSTDRESDLQYEDDMKQRHKLFDRLPMYKADLKFEEEKIKMFYQLS